jgi:hypothetical protein
MLGFSPLASAPLGDDGVVVVLAQQGNASLVSSSSLAALAQTVASGSLVLSGVGSASFVPGSIIFANASLSSSGTILAESSVVRLAATNLAAIGSVSFDSDLNAKGQVSIEAIGSISAQGGVKVFALASLSSVGSTLLVGERILFGATQLSSSCAYIFYGELKYGGRFKPIVGELPRWTEGGDTRVTEDGEPRVADVTQNIGESSILVDSSVTLFTSEVYAKYLDVWNVAETSVKNNGEWVEPVSAYQNINGNWKRIA